MSIMSGKEKINGVLRASLHEKNSANKEILRYAFFSFLLCDVVSVSAYTMFSSTQEKFKRGLELIAVKRYVRDTERM
jgi:hypothetical protein